MLSPLWHGSDMPRRSTKAGGFFLTLSILLGLVAGVAMQNPMQGVLIGTGIGVVIVVLLWLADRRSG